MTTIELTLTGATAVAQVNGKLTAGMGKVPVTIACDSTWDGLVKTLICKNDFDTDIVVGVERETNVDPAMLRRGSWGRNELYIGLEGRTADGTLVVASTMAYCGKILPGAKVDDRLTEGEKNPVWAQIMGKIGSLENLRTDSKGNLVEAINDALGGNSGFSPTVEISKEGKTTTITITDINGTQSAVIHDGEDGEGSSGSESAYTLVGSSPQKIAQSGKVKLVCEENCAYTILSDTVADVDINGASFVNCSAEYKDGAYELTMSDKTTGWFSAYMEATISGLEVGKEYNFVFDAANQPYDFNSGVTVGYWVLWDGDGALEGKELLRKLSTEASIRQVRSFVATTETAVLRWYVAESTLFAAVGTDAVAHVAKIYVNRAGTSGHTAIVEKAGTFSGSMTATVSAGVTIDAEPACDIYLKTGTESSSATRHAGKTCVCFGDSITGNMTEPYDYPSVLAQETGMTVVNGGFGGCRMSDTHPTAAYAAFSMVKIAEAVASGDWSLQDTYAGSLDPATNASERLAALKGVQWENVDFITIAYGTNDINGQVTIDNEADPRDTATYLGALRYALETILKAYPHLKVLLLTPIYRYFEDQGIDSDNWSHGDQKFTDWGDGLLAVAADYKFPAVDLYRSLGFNALNRDYYFSSDGVHPNAQGLAVLGKKIAGKLLAEY